MGIRAHHLRLDVHQFGTVRLITRGSGQPLPPYPLGRIMSKQKQVKDLATGIMWFTAMTAFFTICALLGSELWQ